MSEKPVSPTCSARGHLGLKTEIFVSPKRCSTLAKQGTPVELINPLSNANDQREPNLSLARFRRPRGGPVQLGAIHSPVEK